MVGGGSLSAFYPVHALDHPYVQYLHYLTDGMGIVNGNTVANYISAVHASLSRWFIEPPPQSMLAWDLVHRLKQLPSAQPRFRDAASPDLVQSVLSDSSLDMGVRTTVLLMWFLSSRISEVIAPSATSFDASYTLLRRDVEFLDTTHVRLFVPHSKSDRFNNGSNVFIAATGGQFCPVALLRQYLASTHNFDPASPLLRRLDGSNVTRSSVVAALKKHASKIGLDPRFISSHSLRSGSATKMASEGLQLADILLQGRWASEEACLKYLRMTIGRVDRISSALSLNKSDTSGVANPISTVLLPLRTRRFALSGTVTGFKR